MQLSQTGVILIWVLILFVILLSTPWANNSKNKQTEGFYTYYGYYKKYCSSCGWRSRESCSNCTNCGYCITADGNGECVPGDSSGPYDKSNCMYWEYGDPYYYWPYDNIFPTIKTKNVYPYYHYQVRKPNRWRLKDTN